ncbi:SixA phosphatase family protein [Adhaeribacter rhizoryzae]|uniref:Histidine phosphatase family protein n=1 Tax=Adhaeribacter rhizoryzae TaxID=2607907 RepID=A0A5M6DP26_9BACT|nr:histidine phosphatase family protein [Adhaeribacter rhizoryzae]KAA5549183.1 histidine phosphatase family protein [Adhaeribacter rhizoryzae]
MKTLYLMRHAKSSWDFPELSDHDRPLNNRGRKDAPLMGRELASREVTVDLIVASSAVRALTTATLVARELEYDTEKIAVEEEIFQASKQDLLSIIKNIPNQFDKVLLVGHNYTISELANLLSPEMVPTMPTAAVVCLNFNCDTWAEIAKQNAAFAFYEYPKNLK